MFFPVQQERWVNKSLPCSTTQVEAYTELVHQDNLKQQQGNVYDVNEPCTVHIHMICGKEMMTKERVAT